MLCFLRAHMKKQTPCLHVLHVLHSVGEGFENICVRTINTDVLVLAVASVNELKTVEGSQCKLDQLWLALGTGKSYRYVPTHSIASQLGPNKSRAPPVIHALTGSDVVSSFCGKGGNPFGNHGKSP